MPKHSVQLLRSRLNKLSGRSIALPPKQVDRSLVTPQNAQWAREVLRRAGYECEKCGRRGVRLFADHIKERQDGGEMYSLLNGQALCGSCHTNKTIRERQKRFGLIK